MRDCLDMPSLKNSGLKKSLKYWDHSLFTDVSLVKCVALPPAFLSRGLPYQEQKGRFCQMGRSEPVLFRALPDLSATRLASEQSTKKPVIVHSEVYAFFSSSASSNKRTSSRSTSLPVARFEEIRSSSETT